MKSLSPLVVLAVLSPFALAACGGSSEPENLNALTDTADMVVALDRLQAMAPKVESVSLVVAWFGDDLRAGRGEPMSRFFRLHLAGRPRPDRQARHGGGDRTGTVAGPGGYPPTR